MNPEEGIIEKNGKHFGSEERRKEAWIVRKSEIKRFGLFKQSVRSQIRFGLAQQSNLLSESEIMQRFNLSPERYGRPLRQFSHEGWRASCAIGVANNKTIFCFPHIGYSSAHLIKDKGPGFRDLLEALKNPTTLILVPTHLAKIAGDLCDEAIYIGD